MREPVAEAIQWIKDNLITTTRIRIGVIVIFLLLAIWAITLERYGLVLGYSEVALWFTVALVSVAPELAGIVIGVVTIDYLNERRQNEELKAHLTRDLISNVTDFAVRAVDELREHGWLENVLVENKHRFKGVRWQHAYLHSANLNDAVLMDAQLAGTKLAYAQLQGAKLGRANLDGAYVVNANLERAYLAYASFEGADLTSANLAGADLREANFQNASLKYADLTGAIVTLKELKVARTLYGGTMQDGTRLFRQQLNPIGPTFKEWVATREALAEIDSGDEEE